MNRPMKQMIQGFLVPLASVPLLRPILRSIDKVVPIHETVLQRLPVVKTFTLLIGGHSYRYSSLLYDNIGRSLYWGGFELYEPETMAVFQRLVQKANTFFDIGANTGIFTLVAHAFNPKIITHAFEPVPAVYKALSLHVSANGLLPTTVCNQLALGDRQGEVSFHMPHDTMASASFDLNGFCNLAGNVERVQCTTLNEYIKSRCIEKVDLIKIDVEGFEHQVLEGARELLTRDTPTMICECLPACKTELLHDILRPLGYKIYHITDKGLVRKEAIEHDKKSEYRNYLFITENQYRLNYC